MEREDDNRNKRASCGRDMWWRFAKLCGYEEERRRGKEGVKGGEGQPSAAGCVDGWAEGNDGYGG